MNYTILSEEKRLCLAFNSDFDNCYPFSGSFLVEYNQLLSQIYSDSGICKLQSYCYIKPNRNSKTSCNGKTNPHQNANHFDSETNPGCGFRPTRSGI